MRFLPDDPAAMLFENQREDNNGTLAGIVKVIITLDGVKFEGASLLHQEKRDMGEYWVWMADRATRLTIRTPNYQPLEINFRDYDFQMVHSKNTYKLVITVPAMGGQALDDGMGYLAMKVEPSNAQVMVDGSIRQPQQNTSNEYMILVPRGEYSYQVSATGYAPQSETVTIGKDTKMMSVTLVASIAQLTVDCPTSNAQVYVNEQLKGTVPWSGSLGPYTYRIEVRKDGYRSQTKTVSLSENATQTVTFEALSAITGNLNIAYTPMGSDVYVDGSKVGSTPGIFRNISVGSHKVEIRKEGFTTASVNTTVKENATTDLSGSLTAVANIGYNNSNVGVSASSTNANLTVSQMFELGEDYFIGRNGKSKDYAKAIEWYNKAADKGNADAMIRLAECYEEGYGVAKNERKGVEYEKNAAALGNAKAQYWLGNTYCIAYGGETRNYAEALKWYLKSAEQGYAGGQNGLGNMYRNGDGVEKDYTEAVKWYRMAAEQGDSLGQCNLGSMYMNGYGVEKDYAEAVNWYRKAAEQGFARGQNNLGYMFRYGYGVEKDYTEAVKWYRMAAEQGHAGGQCNLGYMYENGYGVTQDKSEAVKWYRKAAEQGDAGGQESLGDMYRFGHGVPQNYLEAEKWYRKAAEQGHARGQNALGVMYVNGVGVKKDYAEAVKWFRKAAEQGYAYSHLNLGYVYEKGRGVKKDIKQAKYWYEKAAAQGVEDAKNALKRLNGN